MEPEMITQLIVSGAMITGLFIALFVNTSTINKLRKKEREDYWTIDYLLYTINAMGYQPGKDLEDSMKIVEDEAREAARNMTLPSIFLGKFYARETEDGWLEIIKVRE